MNISNNWEKIHSDREWGKYPNEELIRFIGKYFFKIEFEKRNKIKILELGVGQGANVWFLVREGFDVYGVDISNSAIEKMKNRLKKENMYTPNMTKKFVPINILNMDFPKDYFDVVIDVASMQYLSYTNNNIIFEKTNQLLKKNGYFFVWHLLKDSWGYDPNNCIDKDTVKNVTEGPAMNQGNIYYATMNDLCSMLNKNNFKIIEKEILKRTYQNEKEQMSYSILIAQKR
ncbi:class I SAM-dependent methyltransferase [archaeon]|jgi:cyclopropane fatty-acyl-phospholipid synthase-like methyltransferase|nr:class I SAM-dependent methyltransferase [archaeon]MBT4647062.1 class I SAM-dependent methyltransferase [archaeon]MBT6820971.1 class I SAM-dependent methyltransferase [archaeon]